MRPTGLLLLAASPVLCAVQPRTVAQVPVLVGNKNVATSSYPQDSAVNGTIGMSHTVFFLPPEPPFSARAVYRLRDLGANQFYV